MKDTVSQWTDVKSNQHIVDTENHFKRLVSEKINKTNQVKFTSQKSEVKISAQKSEQILSGFDRMKNPFPFKLYTVSINEI